MGVRSVQVPAGPVAVVRTTGPLGVAPTAAQVGVGRTDGGLAGDAEQVLEPLVVGDGGRVPHPAAVGDGAVEQFAGSGGTGGDGGHGAVGGVARGRVAARHRGGGQDRAREPGGLGPGVRGRGEVGRSTRRRHRWPTRWRHRWSAVHEIPVTVEAPVGNVDSAVQVLPPATATGTVITVASDGLEWSPVAVARHVDAVGQVMVPTEVTAPGSVSEVTEGVHAGLWPRRPGSPSQAQHTRRRRRFRRRRSHRWWWSGRRWSRDRSG